MSELTSGSTPRWSGAGRQQGRGRHMAPAGARKYLATSLLAVSAFLWAPFAQAGSSITRTSSFDYDPASGILTKEVVEPGVSDQCVVTAYGLDAYGRKTSITTRNCNGSAGAYNGAIGEAATPSSGSAAVFTARSVSSAFGADQRFVTTTTNALNQTETKTYDGRFGVVTGLTGPNQLTTGWAYDDFGRKLLEKRADGNGTRWQYDYCTSVAGGTLSCPTIAGAVSAYAITVTPVAAPIDLSAKTTGAANGAYSRTYFDAMGRELRSETQGSDVGGTSTLIYQDTQYDILGNVYQKSRPYYAGQTSYWVSYTYDKLSRVTDVNSPTDTAASGAITHTTYSGLTVSVTDPLSHTTTQVSNVAGQTATVTDAKGGTLTRSYDPLGNLVQTQDAKGNITSMVYDTRGRKTALYDPDMGVWAYTYNALGEMVSQTDAKGQVSTMAYDVLGRMTSQIEPSLTSTWSYDKYADGSACAKGIGKLCEAVAGNAYRRKNVYDSLGRASSTTSTVGSTYTGSVSYDGYGRVSTQTYPSGLAVQNTYTAGLGFLKTVVDTRTGGALWTANAVDAVGHLTQYTYGNGVVTTNQFFATSARLSSMQAGAGNGVQNLSVSHDNAGQLLSRIDALTGVTATYTYDELSRVTGETRWGGSLPAAQTIGWAYDAIGNMVTRTESGSTNTYNYNTSGSGSSRPHAVANVSGFVNGYGVPFYTYDANGNLLTGAGRSVTWNSFNKAQSIAGTNTRLDLLYDTEHQRAQETYYLNGALQRTTVYLGAYEEESGVAGSKKKHYISAGGATIGMIVCTASPCTSTANTSTQYWHTDDLGSVSVVTDAAGAVLERMAYEPFGKRRNSSGVTDTNGTLTPVSTNRGFTGHEELDEVGLINMNGRIYDPGLGRFMSADPFIQSSASLQSYNRYAYVWNNPLNATDPSGYFKIGGWLSSATKAFFWPSDTNVFNAIRSQPGQAQIDRYIATHRWAYATGKIVLTEVVYFYSGSSWAAAGAAAAYDGYYTYYQTGDMWAARRAGGQDMAVAGLNSLAGQYATDYWENVAAHAAIGCASARASGGSCGAGARAGALGPLLGNPEVGRGDDFGTFAANMAINAMIGGIGSRLGGGSFEDGAVTGAFGYLFNHWEHRNGELVWVEDCGCNRTAEELGRALSQAIDKLGEVVDAAATMLRPGIQYSLRASSDGLYPDVRGGVVELKAGDVWKYGETTQLSTDLADLKQYRYSGASLLKSNLDFVVEHVGTQATAKYMEAIKLNGYVMFNGQLPPGNKTTR